MWNWDFSYVIPSLLILIIVMGYYFALPRLPIRLNKTFLALMINEGVAIFFDITSSFADNMYEVLPAWLLVILNTVFFVSFILNTFLFFKLTVAILRLDPAKHRGRALVMNMPFIFTEILALLGVFTGWIFYINENGYNRGPLHFTIYVCLYFYLFSSFLFTLRHKNRIRRKHELVSTLSFNTILLLGSLCRILFPTMLMYDTFCLMAILIIYLTFGNPEFYLERRNMAFNSKALREYIEEHEVWGRFKILAFIIRDYRDAREKYGGVQMNQGISVISAYLKKNYPEYLGFYYQGGRFVLVGGPDMDWEDVHDELRHRFMSPWRSDDAELYLDASFALIDCANGYRSADEVLNGIGLMLEKAEQMGDDFNILADNSVIQEYEDQVQVKLAMDEAIDKDGVEVYLQPIVDSVTHKLVGAEALARIRDKEGQIIPPTAFVPIAEKNGRINQLGEQVFEKVCHFISVNDLDKMGMSFINVNLSPIQFMRADLGKRFSSDVIKYGVDVNKIHLEITEEAMTDEQQMEKQIQLMQKRGFKFVLDDYGKGYSNLTRLKKTQFINVKLDMDIVWDYCLSQEPILPMMVSAFKKMNFSITAEGIETEEMAQKMMDIGCDYLQGMMFMPPVTMDQFVEKYGAAD